MAILKKIKSKIKSFITKPYSNNANLNLLTRYSSYDRAIILGSSPSINELELNNFSDDTMVISMGNFFEHPEINQINPSIHIFAASHPPITEAVLINWWTRCNQILPLSTPVMVEKRDQVIAERIFNKREVFTYSYGGSFPIDFTKQIKSPFSVSQIAMQLGVYVKIKKIYFIGIDLHWRLLDPYLHFYSHEKPSLEYYLKKEGIKVSHENDKDFSKNKFYYVHKVYMSFEEINKQAKLNGVSLLNANKNSKFDVFDYEDYE